MANNKKKNDKEINDEELKMTINEIKDEILETEMNKNKNKKKNINDSKNEIKEKKDDNKDVTKNNIDDIKNDIDEIIEAKTKNEDNKKDKKKKKKENKEDNSIDNEQLEKIAEEISDNKTKNKVKREKQNKDIIRNLLICGFLIVYFVLLLLGKEKIPTIEYIRDLKTFIIFDLVVALVLFEVSINKDNDIVGIHGAEMTVVGVLTIFILDLFNKQNEKINMYIYIIMGCIVLYYIVKSIVLTIKKRK